MFPPDKQVFHSNLLPVQVFWGWAEGDPWGCRGLGGAAGRGSVWSAAGEDRCGRPAASRGGDGDDVDLEDGYVDVDEDDREGDYVDVAAVLAHWSTPNEAPPRLLSKKMIIYIYLYYSG